MLILNVPSLPDHSKLLLCCEYTSRKHATQRNEEAVSSCIIHSLGVAKLLVESGVHDLATLQAAMLCNTVEASNTTLEELEQSFGKEVRNLVEECSDDKSLPKMVRKHLQIERASSVSFRAKNIRLALKLYRLRDLTRRVPSGWTPLQVQEYFSWAKQVTDRLKGTNHFLEIQLDAVYSSIGFTFEEGMHKARQEKMETWREGDDTIEK
ncbi:uncharacterized protein VTP21DRAFT_10666 [Calcarisporiella thermophila]|uniref:uncharacterized protein n=1 Tax=Calcarisporiella thermophila TaxID=911321 RepID=UPI003742BF1E